MIIAIIIVFVIGYLFITLEHSINLNKTATALLTGVVCWSLYAISSTDNHLVVEELSHHLAGIAEIAFFLLGAMTIVELIDAHQGFGVITERIHTKDTRLLLWIISILTFFLSAVLDNLTTAIVMVSLLRKIIRDDEMRRFFAGIVIIAANAGGAWSPIGDVTTTMLWIGKKVSSIQLIEYIVLPAIVCFVVPFFVASFNKVFKGDIESNKLDIDERAVKLLSSRTMLYLGLGMIIFVPIFKTITHLPPYMGMMLSLGVVWAVSEYIHPEENFNEDIKHKYSPHKALSRIEISSILFFLGILLAIAAFESAVIGDVSILRSGANALSAAIPNTNVIIILLGFLSAIIDNVPLVAAAMGMYNNPMDDHLWHFIAFTAGTGGSMLIIGSAAGVAAMGMEKIDFIWYFKKITWLTAAGYLAGCAAFLLLA